MSPCEDSVFRLCAFICMLRICNAAIHKLDIVKGFVCCRLIMIHRHCIIDLLQDLKDK